MGIRRTGPDLAKQVPEDHAVDDDGRDVLRKTLWRDAVARFLAGRELYVVGMEAGRGPHCRARALTDLGPEVRLISPGL